MVILNLLQATTSISYILFASGNRTMHVVFLRQQNQYHTFCLLEAAESVPHILFAWGKRISTTHFVCFRQQNQYHTCLLEATESVPYMFAWGNRISTIHVVCLRQQNQYYICCLLEATESVPYMFVFVCFFAFFEARAPYMLFAWSSRTMRVVCLKQQDQYHTCFFEYLLYAHNHFALTAEYVPSELKLTVWFHEKEGEEGRGWVVLPPPPHPDQIVNTICLVVTTDADVTVTDGRYLRSRQGVSRLSLPMSWLGAR